MGKPFRAVNLCHTNDFPANKNDKIRGWVEYNGGTCSKSITPEVTHLVASRKAFKTRAPLVEAAITQGTVEIVSLDWLEDSLMDKSRSPRKTKKYEWLPCRRRRQQQKTLHSFVRPKVDPQKQIEDAGLQFDRECAAFEREMAISGYSRYIDNAHFAYLITLARRDILENRIHQFRIKLFQSEAIPRTYCCFALYTRPGLRADPKDKANSCTVAPPGSRWDFTWTAFRKFFKSKTGVDWEERSGRVSGARTCGEGKDGANDLWEYLTPKHDEPQGLIAAVGAGTASSGNNKQSFMMTAEESNAWDADVPIAKTPGGGW